MKFCSGTQIRGVKKKGMIASVGSAAPVGYSTLEKGESKVEVGNSVVKVGHIIVDVL